MLYAPRQAGPSAARAALWFPLLLLALAGALAAYPLLLRLGPTRLVDARLRSTPEGMTGTAILFFLFLQFAAPLLLPVAAWMGGELMHWWVSFGLDAGTERRQVRRVVAYGFLPLAAQPLLAAGISLLADSEGNPFNPLASNVAFFLNPNQTSVFWYELAGGLDVFSLWALVATALGLAGLSRQPALIVFPPLALVWLAALALKAWLLA